MNDEIVARQAIKSQVFPAGNDDAVQWLDRRGSSGREQFAGQDKVIADRRADIDKAAIAEGAG